MPVAERRLDMGSDMLLTVTIDTEADNQWDHGAPLRTANVEFWAPFQALCDQHDVKPTYVITSEIAADPLAQELLRRWSAAGTAEVGAHLHPWTTPPFPDSPGLRYNDDQHSFLCELPSELVARKLDSLTAEIEEAVGVRPTSFRAGRFGFDARVARELSRLGYLVDSSVTPMTEWSAHKGLHDLDGGPDFRAHGILPFVLQGTGEPGLLEIPVTIVSTYAVMRRWTGLLELYQTLPVRAARKILFKRWLSPQPVWLRPTPEFSQSDLRDAWLVAERFAAPVAVMMFHSSELMPGGSPYRATQESVDDLLDLLSDFFAFVRARGGEPVTLSTAATRVRAAGGVRVKAL
jgi:hypothetical protein